MTNSVLLALASAALITATPVFANDPAPSSAPQTASAAQAQQAQPAAAKKETKYCVEEEFTGSRISKQVCLTRADWLNRGFDPLKGDQ
ncbi:hypothetical protein [Sphingomonas sp.]|uniref:hypothetical protein n=1 Tax=Sphingomonas sp. TaxID=28214 RepID=UPI003D6D873F